MSICRKTLVPRQQYVRDSSLYIVAVEGEKTEEQYLNIFQSSRVRIKVLSADTDGRSAAKHVLERMAAFETELEDPGPDDERWLMFDVDRQRPQFIEEVTQIGLESGYQLAVSNPCFELWLLLHLREHDPADLECAAVVSRLRSHLGSYSKTKFDSSPYDRDAIVKAIEAAKLLDRQENVRWPSYPGTHVYKLVEKLLVFWPLVK